MDENTIRKFAQELIDKEKWTDILQRFIDVLRINIFIVDSHGRALLTPCQGRYGWDLLTAAPLGFDLLNDHSGLIEKFKKHGFYLEYSYQFDLHSFAIPIKVNDENTIAYMIVGPVILNKRLDRSEYKKIAENLRMDAKSLLNTVDEIRVMSFVSIKSVLDLLDEVAKYIVQLNLQKQELEEKQMQAATLSKNLKVAMQEIQSSIKLDELLVAFLDLALHITNTECGTIMVIDRQKGELSIRVSRGISKNIAQKTRVKIGEGIAGLAAQDNTSFVIHGTETSNNRIKPFLRRPEIRHALIAPLLAKDRVFGILNLHTKKANNPLRNESLDTIQMLSKLTSVAIGGIESQPAAPSENK